MKPYMDYSKLSREYATAVQAGEVSRFCEEIREALELGRQGKPGGLKSSDFSIRDVAEACVESGREWVRSMDPRQGSTVLESGGAVNSSVFSNITGQLLINQLMTSYENPDFVFSRLIEATPTRLSGEKMPNITNIGDKAQVVQEGMPFPTVGLGEDYIETPATVKDGLILAVTKEAIFFDLTGRLLSQASAVGEALGLRKEKGLIDVIIGATNTYKWKGTTYNTYQTSTPWINNLSGAGYALNDWTAVELAEALFDEMLDPNTSEPILVSPKHIVASPAKRHTINRILNATEVRYTASGAASETLAANPLANAGYSSVISQLFYRRLIASGKSAANAKQTWLLGDLPGAFAYMENWPITVVQAPTNSEAEFTQDIVARWKASERGVAAVLEPRKVAKMEGHA